MNVGTIRSLIILMSCVCTAGLAKAGAEATFDPTQHALQQIAKMDVKPKDWPQWGGSTYRNNTPSGKNIPTEWDVETKKNIKWASNLGSQSYGNPVVANDRVYVGTNNGSAYVERYPRAVDLGCLLSFDAKTGDFLWQHSNEKLPTGRVHDWPEQGVCSAPMVDGKRLWYVTNRGTVVCLDTEGFHDGKNNGPFTKEPNENKSEADVIWQLDMMGELGVSQHNMCSCSLTAHGDTLFVITGNGVDEGHINIPAPNAPSFIAVDRNSGKVLWTDKSPGINVLHGQWSSPAVATLGGKTQVICGGGDGWLYSFNAEPKEAGTAELIWKFDCNPKESRYVLGGRADRNHIIGTPVVYDGNVYVAVGEDPEHGEGVGHLWCIDPTKTGDVSTHLVFNKKDPSQPIPHKRIQAMEPEQGDFLKENPNSAMVWHFGAPIVKPATEQPDTGDADDFEKQMHRSCGSVAIKNDILLITDFSGIVHCLEAKDGKQLWSHDMLAASWGSPLIVDGKVYVGDEDGDITIFELAREKKIINEINMGNAVYTTPIVANDVLYIANRTTIFAITNTSETAKKDD